MELIMIIVVIIIWILITRAFGAWMLRINEVIKLQEQNNTLLREIRDSLEKNKEI